MPDDENVALLREALLEHYRLGDCVVELMPSGAMNRGCRVDCEGRSYFLKDYLHKAQPDQISRGCEVQAVVGRAGVPVPELVPSHSGSVVTRHSGHVFTLAEFVVGYSYSRPGIPAEAARQMGMALGRIHLALAEVEPPQPYHPPDAAESRQCHERALALAEASRERSRVDELSCQVLRCKLAALERLAHLAPSLARLQTQFTHGDYQETNVLFRRDDDGVERLAAVLDFDYCRPQPRGAELTRALSLSFLEGETLLPAAWDFLRGYAEVVRVPEEEARLFAPLRAYLSATGAWPITDRYLKPDAYQARWDRFIRPPSDWWEEHAAEMTETFVRVLSCREHLDAASPRSVG